MAMKLTTFELMRRWIKYTNKYEQQLWSPWRRYLVFGNIFRAIDRCWPYNTYNSSIPIVNELVSRYKGIMIRILRAEYTQEDFKKLLAMIWTTMHDKIRALPDYRYIPGMLWRESTSHALRDNSDLKPKFMLRGFLDDIPPCPPIDDLIDSAYEIHKAEEEQLLEEKAEANIPDTFEEGYKLLYRRLLQYSEDVPILTDGAISVEILSKLNPSLSQFERWLFPPRCGLTKDQLYPK